MGCRFGCLQAVGRDGGMVGALLGGCCDAGLWGAMVLARGGVAA